MMALGFREGTATVDLRVDYLRAPSPEASCLVLTAPADVGGRPEARMVLMRAEARAPGGNNALAHAAGRFIRTRLAAGEAAGVLPAPLTLTGTPHDSL